MAEPVRAGEPRRLGQLRRLPEPFAGRPVEADTEGIKLGLGHRLRDLRRGARMSLRQLAERLGCSASALSQIENATAWPSVDLLIRIAHHFDCSFDSLLGRQERPEGPEPSGRAAVSIDSVTLTSTVLEPGDEAEGVAAGRGVAFVFVAEGELTLELGSDTFVLDQGSTMRFEPGRRTGCRNRSGRPTRALWGHVAAE
jgi:transcriptional regulator with XRE-family HTH domain